jgi:two-component system, NarL family, nitrate/nitrite response regulator NarL
MLQSVQISMLGKNEIAREGLRKILSSEQFHIRDSVPDVTMLVTSMKNMASASDAHVIVIDNNDNNDGLAACRKLVTLKLDARLALLSDHYVFEDVAEAFQVGVDAVIIKEISCEPLIESIKLVALGEKVFPSQLANNLTACMVTSDTDHWKTSAASVGLSEREVEILESIMAGMANKVIARQFGICEATVKVHVKAILRKLVVENRTQAATWAVKHGLGAPVQLMLRDVNTVHALSKVVPILGQAA